MKVKQYKLVIMFDPDGDEIEYIDEEIIQEQRAIHFFGNIGAIDVMDDESISKITSYEIADC
tara:strand:- start:2208 stop:2393 length:186 start_codon:yes stop_codon:yes gene_type:complete